MDPRVQAAPNKIVSLEDSLEEAPGLLGLQSPDLLLAENLVFDEGLLELHSLTSAGIKELGRLLPADELAAQ